MRYLLALLAIAGVVVSVLALRVHYSTESAPCSINEKWDCGIVNHSPYAEIRGVPVAAIGIAGYLLIAALAILRRRGLLLVAVLIGMAFALYLTHIEAKVLGVWCVYCVISQGIIATLLLLSIGWVVWHARRGAQSAGDFRPSVRQVRARRHSTRSSARRVQSTESADAQHAGSVLSRVCSSRNRNSRRARK